MTSEIYYTWCEYDPSSVASVILVPARLAEARVTLMKSGGDPGTERLESTYRIDADDVMYRMRMRTPSAS